MERRKALALAATITCVLGSTTVAVAAVGGTSLLGFGGGRHAQLSVLGPTGPGAGLGAGGAGVITRTKDVYDTVTLQSAAKGGGAMPARPAGLISALLPALPMPAGRPTVVRSHAGRPNHHSRGSTTRPRSRPSPPKTPSTPSTPTTSTTEPPSFSSPTPTPTTTTLAPVTTTTRPPGVPPDWPPGKPIPPMPPNCHQPQLEDNGVWNCDN